MIEIVPDVECTTLALFDFQRTLTPGDKAVLFQSIVSWLKDLRCTPDKVNIHMDTSKHKSSDFERFSKRLDTVDWKAIKAFGLFSLLPGPVHLLNNSKVQVSVDSDLLGKPLSSVTVELRREIASLSDLFEFARVLGKAVAPAYGIGYYRNLRLGPSLFASGIIRGDVDDYEADQISGWINFGWPDQIYQRGILRDVYPWNFLTAPQLNTKVGSLPLEEWVRRDKRRGTLLPLTEAMTLWEVAGESIPEVRQALWDAGRIIDLESLRPDGPETSAEEIVGELIGDQDPENVGVIRVEKGKKRELATDEKRTLAKDAKRKK